MAIESKTIQHIHPSLLPDQTAFEYKSNKSWQQKLDEWQPDGSFYPVYAKEIHAGNKKIYPIAQIGELATIMQDTKKDEDFRNRARFVLRDLTPQGLVFAEEGCPTDKNHIPSHVDMAPEGAYAAGTVYFAPDGKINAIDHKSGGIKPDFKSLGPVLEILYQKQNLLADNFTIISLHKLDGAVLDKHPATPSDLKTLKPIGSSSGSLAAGLGKKRPRENEAHMPPPTPRKKPRTGPNFFSGCASLAKISSPGKPITLVGGTEKSWENRMSR